MRARWSERVSTSPNASSAAASRSADSGADCHAARASRSAPARSPSAASARASVSRPTPLVGAAPMKRRTVAASRRSCHSLASARRRSRTMPGQSGLALDEGGVARESGRAPAWRSNAHSTSVCATGSPIDRASVVASLGLPWRTSSIACFAAARSGGSAATGSLTPVGVSARAWWHSRLRGAALFALPRRCAPLRLRSARVTLRLGGLAPVHRHRLWRTTRAVLGNLAATDLWRAARVALPNFAATRSGRAAAVALPNCAATGLWRGAANASAAPSKRHGRGEQPDQGTPRDGIGCRTSGDDGELSVARRVYGCQAGSDTCPNGGGRSGCDPDSAACTNAPPSDAADGMHARPHRIRHNDEAAAGAGEQARGSHLSCESFSMLLLCNNGSVMLQFCERQKRRQVRQQPGVHPLRRRRRELPDRQRAHTLA